VLPKNLTAQTGGQSANWIVGASVALAVSTLLYVVFKSVPNAGGGADLSRFKTGAMSRLKIPSNPPLQPVAAFSGPAGQSINLQSFHGKVILVNLWATWCPPCVSEMPMLGELQAKLGGRDFEVVAVSVDKLNAKEEARTKLRSLSKGSLQFYHDPRMRIVFPLRVGGYPTTILYDRKGKEIARLSGEADWSSPEAVALMKAAMMQR
jgi:thiol-disulfide isomerase/thioredoxin